MSRALAPSQSGSNLLPFGMPMQLAIGSTALSMTISVRQPNFNTCVISSPISIQQLLRNAQTCRGYGYIQSNLDYQSSSFQALARLTPKEKYDRAYRLKRAAHQSVLHEPLPREQWLKPEEVFSNYIGLGYQKFISLQDYRYLRPHVLDVLKEDAERQMWDTVTIQRK
jgi:ubiquinol-cytochrome c reductase subunit 7